jgi:hypothetical protein
MTKDAQNRNKGLDITGTDGFLAGRRCSHSGASSTLAGRRQDPDHKPSIGNLDHNPGHKFGLIPLHTRDLPA